MKHERENGGARQAAERHPKLKQKRNGKVLLIYIVSTGFLIGINMVLMLKMQGDMGRMQEQINKINSSLVLLQEDSVVPVGADVLPKEEQKGSGEGNGGNPAGIQSSAQLPGSFEGQVLAEGSYGALWGLDEVDKPKVRNSAEVLARLNELGKGNELIAEIRRNSFQYPEKMLEALANNPEMADFVSGYTGSKTKASGGFSKEELALEFPLFLQWDPRWGYVKYGDNSCIGLAGCGPTCLSMALYYLTGDESITPDSVAAYSMDNGHYVSGAGTAWGLLTDLPSKYGVKVSEPERSEQTLKSALDQGKVIICSMGPGNFTIAGHFIVIYDYDKEGFMINDPNCVARSMKRWAYGEIAAQIKHIWVLGGEAVPDNGRVTYVEKVGVGKYNRLCLV